VDDTDLTQARAAGEAVFLFGSIAMQRGGLTRAILSRMRLYADAGITVRLLLTDHHFFEQREEADIRRAWSLPDSVEIRYFWQEATPGGTGAPADPLAAQREEPGLTAFSAYAPTGEEVRFYRDGLLVMTKHFTADARLERIQHHDAAGRCTSNQHFEAGGRLVFSDEMNVVTNKVALRRWFDGSGEPWLTIWRSRWGMPAPAVRHRPQPVAYSDLSQVIATWVDEVIADAVAPVVFSDARGVDNVVMALRHPRVRTVAVLHNCHTVEPHTAAAPIKNYWLPLLENVDAFDTIVTLTHKQRDDVASRFGGSNHIVINHPTPIVEIPPARRAPNQLVAVARITRQKKLEDAIRAFSLAAPLVPDARFDIYGTGGEKAKLTRLVRKLDMSDRIRFCGFTDRPLEVFAGATATVLSSRFEGFPLVLNEAMGVGTPFIAYDLNYGPAEVIRHQIDGLLVPPGDIQALAQAMVRVLRNPEFAASLSERAREVRQRFSVGRWSREWLGLFADQVGKTLAPLPREAAPS
jgi:glycosyltransferase involved in cell wall biosynthesis